MYSMSLITVSEEDVRGYQAARFREREALLAIPAVRSRVERAEWTDGKRPPGPLKRLRFADHAAGVDPGALSFREWAELSEFALGLDPAVREEWESRRRVAAEWMSRIIEGAFGVVVRSRLRLCAGNPAIAGDLDAEGILGIVRALDRFDPDCGTNFATYCSYWVTAMMLRCLDSMQMVRLPEEARTLRRKAWDYMDAHGGTHATVSRWDVASALGVSEERLESVLLSVQSMQAPLYDSDREQSGTLEDVLQVETDDPICEFDRKVLLGRLEEAVSSLAPDVREAALLRFPFGGPQPAGALARSVPDAIDRLRAQRVRQLEAVLEWELARG